MACTGLLGMIMDFVTGAALLLALCYLQAINVRACQGRPWLLRLSSGLLFGVICLVGMWLPIAPHEGVFFDARTAVLSMAALFGGAWVALLAGLMAAAGRLWLGGIGMYVGVANVILPLLMGLAMRALVQRGRLPLNALSLWLFGVLLHLGVLLVLSALPAEHYQRILTYLALPSLLVLPLAGVMLGLLLKDIGQRQHTERDLQFSEARLRAIAGALPDLLMVLDEDGRYLEVIAPDPQLLRLPVGALLGKRLHEVLALSQAESLLAFVRLTLSSNAPQVTEYRMQTLAGLRLFEAHARRLDVTLEGRAAVVMIIRDITERSLAEEELRIAAIAFETQQGMFITDASSHILRVNQAFCRITGYQPDDVIGQHTRLLSSGQQGAEFYRQMWQSIHQHGSWQGEIWNRRKSGEVFPEWLSISAVRATDGRVSHYVASLSDISERKEAEQQIRHLAFYDPLTGLPNRRLLLDRLQQAMAHSAQSGQYGALMFLDLDNFKNINDLYGHQAGDQLLLQAAGRLSALVRSSEAVARLGGDEFVLMLEQLGGQADQAASRAEQLGGQILHSLSQPYSLLGQPLHSSVSIGVVLFLGNHESVDELFKRADLSMYEAKHAGKNALRFFDPQMQAVVSTRLRLQEEMRQGLREGHFILHYQAQVEEGCGVVGAEALLRWQHPQQGLLGPAAFIPLAERSGLIQALDGLVLRQACLQLARWQAQGGALARLSLAVNLSAVMLYQPGFVEDLQALLEETGAAAQLLKLEITESLLLDDMAAASQRMNALRQMGIRFSIDDFGTGYSSMAYLQKLPLDQLKIDQSFIRELPGNPSSLAIVRATCAMAQSLGLQVIAEGVETPAQCQVLLDSGCRHFQGYLFARPVPVEQFEALLAAQ